MVSIHAPARARTLGGAYQGRCRRFQSTRPRGREHLDRSSDLLRIGFNPRARAGANLWLATWREVKLGFNPRARAGANPDTASRFAGMSSFNPRARAGANKWK